MSSFIRSFPARAATLLVLAACGGGDGTTAPPDVVASVTVQGPTSPVVVGESAPFSAVLRTAAGVDVTTSKASCITWSTSDARVASLGTTSGASVNVSAVAAGQATITATCGVAATTTVSGSASVQVNNPAPTITDLQPQTIEQGSGALTLVVHGTGFVPGSVVKWAGADRPTSFVSATEVRAALPASDVTRAAGLVAVTVVNPAPGGGASPAFNAAITTARVASIDLAAPSAPLVAGATASVRATLRGSAGQDVTAAQSTCLRWSTSDTTIARVDSVSGVVTTVVGGQTTLTATCGTVTASVALQVINGTPTIVALGPGTIAPGSAAPTLTVIGTGFVPTSVVQVNGAARPTTYVSATTLRAALTAPDVAAEGLAQVTVVNPGPGGGTSTTAVLGVLSIDARVAAGGAHTCTLDAQGKAFCWGVDDVGQLGDGSNTTSAAPVAVRTNLTFRSITAGGSHTCALTAAGQIYCWGSNDSGQLGDGSGTDHSTPVQVQGTVTYASLTAGRSHTCAVATTGEAYCWGQGFNGQLGSGNDSRVAPTLVQGGLRFRSLAAGSFHTCGFTTSGAVYCWGANDGALGNGSTAQSNTPVAAVVPNGVAFKSLAAGAAHTCAVSLLGQAYCWGNAPAGALGNGTSTQTLVPTPVQSSATFAALEAGDEHTCGLTTGGQTLCWGANVYGQLGDATTTDRATPTSVQTQVAFHAIAAGGAHSCALTTSGASYCWGSNLSGELGTGALPLRTLPVSASSGAFAVVRAGGLHTCALGLTGQLSCWGANALNQAGVGAPSTSVVTPTPARIAIPFASLSTGGFHSCALTTLGQAYCWGANGVGQAGTGATSPSVSAPLLVQTTQTFASIAAGAYHTCALTVAGAAHCWGYNGRGALGTTSTADAVTPTAVQGTLAFKSIAAGSLFTCAVTVAGQAYCWGAGFEGQIGNGTRADSPAPTAVRAPTGVTFASVAASGSHACALSTVGAAYCWGSIDLGATVVTSPAAVAGGLTFASLAVGDGHACGLTPSGQAYCWGSNDAGQLGDGTTTDRPLPVAVAGGLSFTSLAAGGEHTCGVTGASLVYCWGSSQLGQLGNGEVGFATVPQQVSGALSFPGVRATVRARASAHASRSRR